MLTNAQLATLKADIAADSALNNQPNNDDGNFAIAAAYNLNATPDYWVWRTSVPIAEIHGDANYNWTRVDNLSVGKARIWDWMFRVNDVINPSLPNVRAGIDATWTGTQPDLDVRAAVYVHCRRLAKRGEKLFASGAGTTASPSLMAFEGQITPSDVSAARNLP